MLRLITILLALIVLNSPLIVGESRLEKQILDKILNKNTYDNRIIPVIRDARGRDGPVNVTTNIYIRQIDHICTKDQEWKTQITFRNEWNDPQLSYEGNGQIKFVNLEDVDRIWKPDTFISNSKTTEMNSDLKPNTLVRIYPNGNVLFSIRLTTTLTCPMDLKKYPFDCQSCSIKFASYGYTTNSINYKWKENDPVQISKTITLPDFTLKEFKTDYCTSKTNTGEYSCLNVEFNFKRVSNKYVCQWLLPTAVLTLISFISFWMKPNKSQRIKLLVVSLILLYLQTIYINANTSATVSYSTLKDCWITTCFIFVLAAFVEFSVIQVLNKCNKCKKSKSNETERLNGNSEDCEKAAEEDKKPCTRKWEESSLSGKIDMVCGVLFPLAFIIYIIIFFV